MSRFARRLQASGEIQQPIVPTGQPFLASISSNGRYFLDQQSNPYMAMGDSPWGLAMDISIADSDWYFQQRQAQGFNCVLFSAMGGEGSGGVDDNHYNTFDGIPPFAGDDLNVYNEPYWARLDAKMALAEQYGFTVFLYVMDTFGEHSRFAQWDFDNTPQHDYRVAYNYSYFVANRYKSAPNVVFMLGGDYDDWIPGTYSGGMDMMLGRCADAIRDAAPGKLMSIQLTGFRNRTALIIAVGRPSLIFRSRIPIIHPTTLPCAAITIRGRATPMTRPALYMEGPYEGENNKTWPGGQPPLTFRHQAMWAMLSGSPGNFYGRGGVWQFNSNWKSLVSDAVVSAQVTKLRTFMASKSWWKLVPDQSNSFVTNGKGTPNTQGGAGGGSGNVNVNPATDTYATAALAGDGTLGMVYVPTSRTLTIDTSKITNLASAYWVNPMDASAMPIAASFSGNTVTSPGNHGADSAGEITSDWLLVMEGAL